jgi:hypothetical protein
MNTRQRATANVYYNYESKCQMPGLMHLGNKLLIKRAVSMCFGFDKTCRYRYFYAMLRLSQPKH